MCAWSTRFSTINVTSGTHQALTPETVSSAVGVCTTGCEVGTAAVTSRVGGCAVTAVAGLVVFCLRGALMKPIVADAAAATLQQNDPEGLERAGEKAKYRKDRPTNNHTRINTRRVRTACGFTRTM